MDILYAFAAASALCFAFMFISQRQSNVRANRLAALALFAIFLSLLASVLDEKLANAGIKWLRYSLLLECGMFFLGPLFYFYTKTLTSPFVRLGKKDLWHLALPTCGVAFFTASSFLLPVSEQDYSVVAAKGWNIGFVAAELLLYIILAVYTVLEWLLLYRHKKAMLQLTSDADRRQLNWLRHFLTGISGMYLVWMMEVFFFSEGWFPWLAPVCYLVGLFYLTYFGLRQQEVYAGLQNIDSRLIDNVTHETTDAQKNPARILDPKLEHVKSALLDLLETQKPFLDNGLTLTKLASQMNMPPYQLSELINIGFGENFFQFINRYRVMEAREILTAKEYAHLTVEAAGYEAGFNSKTTFNTTFKKMTGMSPSEFRWHRRASEQESVSVKFFNTR